MAAPTRCGSRHACEARRVREIMTAVCDIHLIILSQLKTYTKFEKRQNSGARREDLFPPFFKFEAVRIHVRSVQKSFTSCRTSRKSPSLRRPSGWRINISYRRFVIRSGPVNHGPVPELRFWTFHPEGVR